MKPWHLRPQEIANLLNPAFCGQVLHAAVKAHVATNDRSLPYPLAFLVLPLVLHRATRDAITGQTRQFQNWIGDHEEVKIGFAERARQTAPYARESILFVLQTKAVTIAPDGGLLPGVPLKRLRRSVAQGDDDESCVAKAAVLGRWFATAGSPATVFATIGIQP